VKRTPRLSPKKTPKQARARATYEAILKAGARILEERGYAAFTTNRVAERAGVGIASLYEYFPNKESIVAGIVEDVVHELLRDIGKGLDAARVRTPDEALSVWIQSMFDAVDQRRKLVTVLVREVPFLHDVPVMRSVRAKLVELSREGSAFATDTLAREHLDALTYLLPLMLSHAVVESVVRMPKHLERSAVEQALVFVTRRVLLTRG